MVLESVVFQNERKHSCPCWPVGRAAGGVRRGRWMDWEPCIVPWLHTGIQLYVHQEDGVGTLEEGLWLSSEMRHSFMNVCYVKAF